MKVRVNKVEEWKEGEKKNSFHLTLPPHPLETKCRTRELRAGLGAVLGRQQAANLIHEFHG
jgi:hypothetical protein